MLTTENKTIHLPGNIHHAYITFKRSVFLDIQQDERSEYYRKEDSKFVRDIIKFYGNTKETMVFLELPLVLYS